SFAGSHGHTAFDTVGIQVGNATPPVATIASSVLLVGPASVTPATEGVVPRLTHVSFTHHRFRVAATPTALSANRTPASTEKRTPTGTDLRYTLSENAGVSIKLEPLLPGVAKGHLCVSRYRATGRPCTRASRVGTLTRRGRAGANRVAFTGRLG